MNNVIFFIVINGMKVCVNLCINVIRRSLNNQNNQNNQRTPSLQSFQSLQSIPSTPITPITPITPTIPITPITPSLPTIPITPSLPTSFYQLSSLQDSGGTATNYHLSLCPCIYLMRRLLFYTATCCKCVVVV